MSDVSPPSSVSFHKTTSTETRSSVAIPAVQNHVLRFSALTIPLKDLPFNNARDIFWRRTHDPVSAPVVIRDFEGYACGELYGVDLSWLKECLNSSCKYVLLSTDYRYDDLPNLTKVTVLLVVRNGKCVERLAIGYINLDPFVTRRLRREWIHLR